MKNLTEFRRFIRIQTADGNYSEIRSYVAENSEAIAQLLHVGVETLMTAVDKVSDDASLAKKLLGTIAETRGRERDSHAETRTRAAQAASDVIASAARWDGNRAHVDMRALLASAATSRNALLVFACDAFTVGVYVGPLVDLAKIRRVRNDLSGWVDAEGLHVRWGRGGGLNLRPRQDRNATTVVLRLSPKSSVVAA